jgi:hypothetical protein
MTRFPIIRCALAVILLGGGIFLAETVPAQAPGITAKPLLRTSLSGDEGKKTVVLDRVRRGGSAARHRDIQQPWLAARTCPSRCARRLPG